MRAQITKHILSIIVVTIFLGGLYYHLQSDEQQQSPAEVKGPVLPELDWNDEFQSLLFREMGQAMLGFSARQIDSLRLHGQEKLVILDDLSRQRILNRKSPETLLRMFGQFFLLYLLVMFISYYAVETLGLYLFIRYQQRNQPLEWQLWRSIKDFKLHTLRLFISTGIPLLRVAAKALLKLFAYFVLFAPAYVIAYSIKSDFSSRSLLFMILLGVVSNGLLITYANKFFHILRQESNKGYVRLAVVKNLKHDYTFSKSTGIRWRNLWLWPKKFENHVLQHIYINAHHQYLHTLKEQAAFVITGLVIIEMALNIHGHFNYELMQQILYENFDLVAFMLLLIFYAVKLTDLSVDTLIWRKRKKMGWHR